MTTPNPAVFEQLLQMGLEVPIVHEAARRFSDVERAVNWAFDHGMTWLNDNNVASSGDFSNNATGLDFLDSGPPQQQTHNNSPNVSPLISAQSGSGMDVDDLRQVDMTGLEASNPSQPLRNPPSLDEDPAVFRNSLDTNQHHHTKTYGKKSKTPASELGVAAIQPGEKLGNAHRQLPPPPPLESFNGPVEESEEDQIQRAIRMSLGAESAMETDTPTCNETQDPNRRLRASAPPPEFSTEAEGAKAIELGSNNPFKNAAPAGLSSEKSVTFSKVADETIDQGSKSLVPVAPSADSTNAKVLTALEQEDADLQAALSASLSENAPGGFSMTTSATDTAAGASAVMEGVDDVDLDLDPDSKSLFNEGQQGVPVSQEGAPMAITALWENGLFAANIIQCLMAVPRFREAVSSAQIQLEFLPPGNERLAALTALSRFMQTSSNAWVTTLFGMNTLFNVAPSAEISRPAALFMEQVVDAWLRGQALFSSNAASDASGGYEQSFDPLFISETTLINSGDSAKNIVSSYNLTHSPSSGASISDAISSELWSESPNRFFSSLAHVLPISITRTARNVWGEISPLLLEEDLYMDRFIAENASKVAQLRGNEGISKRKIETLQEELKCWTTHKSNDISALLDKTTQYFERKLAQAEDDASKAEAQTILYKMKDAGSSITARREALMKELEEEQQKSKDCWDQPEMNKYKYTLRGVCFYAGWIARTSMYCYVKSDDGSWWKISDTTVETTTLDQIKGDRTGLYFDTGAYLLVYAREESNLPSEDTEVSWLSPLFTGAEADLLLRNQAAMNMETDFMETDPIPDPDLIHTSSTDIESSAINLT
ncbi:hypothetical protein QFC21_000979 [Naganishia friedmannii]|uniref:Uncharacterized protein n=1 Tax=Naganishia friedmannii TaxID=89922 RepID=A0ACC2WAB0_9TREE|nr:hypothetical protein QFC21_000979 [Naganishia friedmannii]